MQLCPNLVRVVTKSPLSLSRLIARHLSLVPYFWRRSEEAAKKSTTNLDKYEDMALK
jgi:hypothetical protein